ncbi:unnamed protein product [Miscanthus lutarioriparius]|uniref:Uncharacterized protein n=1 Tax=Miscanthus lutarioriparius TaxID=422564 RepID=A0A811QEP3_9POAL|nr:unnamed protein product [Miscanthus lutarioriparius]
MAAAAIQALEESVRRSGTRALGRLAPWSQDTREELALNLSLLAEAFLQLLASGLGTLALVWATVVLLGGYSTALVRTDFWFTTAIVFVETARIVGYNSAPEAKFFLGVPAAFYHLRHVLRVTSATNIVGLLAMAPALVVLAPIFLAIACMSLSLIRLHGITNPRRHDEYGGPNNGGNLKPALILFYSLVLAQGVLFLLWFPVAMNRLDIAKPLGSKYLANELLRRKKNLENYSSSRNNNKDQVNEEEEMELVDRYVTSIAETCIQKGVSGTINTTLVSFAAELLLQSQHPDDYISAVSVLHSLVIKNKERSDAAIDQICASEKLVCRLVRMLRSSGNLVSIPQPQRIETAKQTKNDLDVDIKAHVAQIVAKLACKLRLADIPGAGHCISSLLDYSHPISMKVRNKTGSSDDDRGGVNYQLRTTDIESESRDRDQDQEEETSKPLFLHGLVILRELAADPENCTEMYSTMDLVHKIIAPISSGLLMAIKNDETTVEVVKESLRVLAKLTSGTAGESGRKLCHELTTTTTKYGSRTAENLLWILRNSSDQEMGERATEILSRLTLSKQTMHDFVVVLQRRLLVDPDQDSPLRTEAAGKALSALVTSRGHEFRDKFPDIHQLLTIMGAADDAYCKEYRVVMAEMLAKICARSRTDQDRNLLSSVASNALSTVLKAIVTETGMDRKFLASFLGLAVQIREKLATAEAFADAVTGLLPMGNNVFAEKLERIIEMTNDSEDETCLAIMKSVTKLVTWMTEIDTISPGYSIEYFPRDNIVNKLEDAVEAMAHLERYMVMTGGADENKGYVTLQMLVETARNKLVSPSWQQR